jgi:hypothetical protein
MKRGYVDAHDSSRSICDYMILPRDHDQDASMYTEVLPRYPFPDASMYTEVLPRDRNHDASMYPEPTPFI